MKQVVLFISFAFYAWCVSFTNAAEFTCNCKVYNGQSIFVDGKNVERDTWTNCPKKPQVLEYEQGYFAFGSAETRILEMFNIINDQENFVTASKITDAENYTNIHFNKKSKTLRLETSIHEFIEPIYSGTEMITEEFSSTIKYNIKYHCQ